MITIIALVLQVLISLISPANSAVVVIPPMPAYAPGIAETEHDFAEEGVFDECFCDDCCHAIAVDEYTDEFTALFNSYSYKLSKNGRSMINGKFVKMGA